MPPSDRQTSDDRGLIDNNGDLTSEAADDIRIQTMRKEIAEAILAGTRTGVPGRPVFTRAQGRRAILGVLDTMLARTPNIQKLYQAMQEQFDTDPVGFVSHVALPFMPKSMNDSAEETVGGGDQDKGSVLIIPSNGRQ